MMYAEHYEVKKSWYLKEHLNSIEISIKITVELESDCKLALFDTEIKIMKMKSYILQYRKKSCRLVSTV